MNKFLLSDDYLRIKKLVITALVSDDDLLDLLVLKGGNALELIHGVMDRSSFDFDYSIEDEIADDELEPTRAKMERALKETFRGAGYEVFDVKIEKKPGRVTEDLRSFWGGYELDFKIIERAKYRKLADNHDSLRKNAVVVGPRNKRTVRVDISKHEYCASKTDTELDGYTVFVYTPQMIVCEKLRAICQQMPVYRKLVKSSTASPRARDFFDIHSTVERFGIDLTAGENLELLQNIFEAKHVPLGLLAEIPEHREYHRADFPAVEATVTAVTDLKEFDFYFDYVVKRSRAVLQALGVI